LSSTTFSPDGRIFQVEYAAKTVEASGTVVGIRAKDGVVLVVEKPILSKLARTDSGSVANRRIATVDVGAGVTGAGIVADLRALASRAREEAASYRSTFETPISGESLAERLSLFMQAYTLYSSVRPFCASLLIAAVDTDQDGDAQPKTGASSAAAKKITPNLYMVEPSGLCLGYRACAAGKGRQAARTELEKLDPEVLSTEEALDHAVRIIHLSHDEAKDRPFVVEASWIGPASSFRHQQVPEARLAQSVLLGKVCCHHFNQAHDPDAAHCRRPSLPVWTSNSRHVVIIESNSFITRRV